MSDPSNSSREASEQDAGEGVKIRKRAEAAPAEQVLAPIEEEPVPVAMSAPEPEDEPASASTPQLGRRVVDPSTISPRPAPIPKPSIATTFEDASATTDDFAALFEGAMAKEEQGAAPERRRFEPGDRVTAPVVHIDAKYIYVDLGGRGEARAPIAQYIDEEGALEVEVGQSYEFAILRFSREGIEVGKQLEIRQAGLDALEDAMAANLPLTGRVTGKNKGGFVVSIAGIDAFCPISQIDERYVEDPDLYLNQTFSFLVTDVRDGGRSVVVSRAALLRQESERKRAETMKTLAPGATMQGVVRSIAEYGAFVDLGGIDGLVHVSELSWGNVAKVEDEVKPGDTIEVKVLSIEEREGKDLRIALSVKQLQDDPWSSVIDEFHNGQEVEGVVTRLAPFGAFVEIKPGVEGLVHVSEMSWEHVRRPEDVAHVGQPVRVQIVDIDLARQRIGLSMKAVESDPWADLAENYPIGSEVEGTVEKIEDFGAFVALGGGITALLPRSEMQLGSGETPYTKARPGTVLKARVLNTEPDRRRMALTLRERVEGAATQAASDRGARRSARSYSDTSGSSFGTLGDLLRSRDDTK